MDYLHNINLPLDNYISRSNDLFLSNPQHVQQIFEVISKAISGNKFPKVLYTVILCSKYSSALTLRMGHVMCVRG
jgi:hypothetical protein